MLKDLSEIISSRNGCVLVLPFHVIEQRVRVLADEEGLVIASTVMPLEPVHESIIL